MRRERRILNRVAMATFALVAVGLILQLTIGPTVWLCERGMISRETTQVLGDTVYFPLQVAIRVPGLKGLILAYLWVWKEAAGTPPPLTEYPPPTVNGGSATEVSPPSPAPCG